MYTCVANIERRVLSRELGGGFVVCLCFVYLRKGVSRDGPTGSAGRWPNAVGKAASVAIDDRGG